MQAIYWYARSAAQSYDRAQYNLGVCYEKGQGVESNIDMAAAMYTAAAAQGNQKALAALKRLGRM